MIKKILSTTFGTIFRKKLRGCCTKTYIKFKFITVFYMKIGMNKWHIFNKRIIDIVNLYSFLKIRF